MPRQSLFDAKNLIEMGDRDPSQALNLAWELDPKHHKWTRAEVHHLHGLAIQRLDGRVIRFRTVNCGDEGIGSQVAASILELFGFHGENAPNAAALYGRWLHKPFQFPRHLETFYTFTWDDGRLRIK